MRRRALTRAGFVAAMCVFVAGTASADTPRADFAIGLWEHESQGTLTTDDPALGIGPGVDLSSERESYERFSIRFGNRWWAPTVRLRHTSLTSHGHSFVDDSTMLSTDTTDTSTDLDFEQLDGLVYLTRGDTIRGELGAGLKKIDGHVQSVQVRNTSFGGMTVNRAERDLSSDLPLLYGGVYAKPASWLSFGLEGLTSAGSDTDMLDFTFKFIVKPWEWMGIEAGYRKLLLESGDDNGTAYDLEFAGTFAGLSLMYGSRAAGLFSPDADQDGIVDGRDKCPDTPRGTSVNSRGCERDQDRDRVADAYDQCPQTPKGAKVDESGCPVDDAAVSAAAPEAAVTEPAGPDFDDDGVADSEDTCAETPAGVPVGPDGCPLRGGGAVQEPPPEVAARRETARAPDEDRDGVPDRDDRCRRTVRGMRVDGTGCAIPQSSVLQGITFVKNSSYLHRDSEVLLLEVVDALKAQKSMRVVIQGHTCDLGDDNYNKWLSQRRANRVLEFLVRHGIDASRLLAVGHGEEQPLVPNDDERMRELNRRTVFQVLKQ